MTDRQSTQSPSPDPYRIDIAGESVLSVVEAAIYIGARLNRRVHRNRVYGYFEKGLPSFRLSRSLFTRKPDYVHHSAPLPRSESQDRPECCSIRRARLSPVEEE